MVANGYTNPTVLPELPEGWRRKAIEELCENVTTGGTPSRRNELFYRGHHNWFKTGELKDAYVEDSEEKITSEALENSAAKLFPPETVLMAMYGDGKTITSLGILRREAASNQACCAMIANRKSCEPRFLFYALRHHREDFIRLASGGAQRNLSGKLIRRFAVNTPSLPEQRAIASVLGALDNKIELNRRMNETLEALAQSLFKSWFVDATQSALPKGWREGKVSELATISRDGINPGEFPDETFDHYSLPAFDEGRTPKPERGDTIMSNKFVVPPGCVMVSKLNPRIPRIWLPDLRGENRAVCSTEFLVTTPKPGVSCEFLYCLFINETFASVFTTMVTGTSGSHQRVKPESLLGMDTVIPSQAVVQSFTEKTAPLLKRISHNIRESRTLAALRDALLPKLLSGELRVNNLKGL